MVALSLEAGRRTLGDHGLTELAFLIPFTSGWACGIENPPCTGLRSCRGAEIIHGKEGEQLHGR